MSSEWTVTKLSEISSKITKGTTPSQKDGGFSDHGINYIKAESVSFDGRIDQTKFSFISPSVHAKLKRSQLQENDILFSMAGVNLGKVGIVERKHVPANTNQALALIRPITDIIEPLYLLYFLQQREVVHFVNNAISQSAQPNINLQQIGDLDIQFPELKTQKSIVGHLNALDKKIELNRQINQTLEQIAQAIFKSWFVDFDPVKAKIWANENGHDPERAAMCALAGLPYADDALDHLNPEQQQQLATTAALFPNSLEESELGEIPSGWNPAMLSNVVELIGGGTPKRSNDEYWGGNIPWFSVKDAPTDGNVFVIDTDEKITEFGLKNSSARLLPEGVTIISARGTVGRLAVTAVPMAMNQSCYGVQGVKGLGRALTYFYLKEAVSTLLQNTHGAVFDTITRDTFNTVWLVESCSKIKEFFETLVHPIFENIKSNLREIQSLAQLRDTLLPKLLSGELSVADLPEIADTGA